MRMSEREKEKKTRKNSMRKLNHKCWDDIQNNV